MDHDDRPEPGDRSAAPPQALAEKTEHLGRQAPIEEELAAIDPDAALDGAETMSPIVDDRLRLIFTCCHPALAMDARVALTLRTLGGLTTPEIARAFLVPEATLAQRLVRAKRKIRDAGIPYRVPRTITPCPNGSTACCASCTSCSTRATRASAGDRLVRRELCGRGDPAGSDPRRRCCPTSRRSLGLLALMLLHDARRETRTGPAGELVLLEDQDRARWDRARIAEGQRAPRAGVRLRRVGPYQLQAAIAALHDEADRRAATPTGRRSRRSTGSLGRDGTVAGRRAEPRGRGRDGRRTGGRPRARRPGRGVAASSTNTRTCTRPGPTFFAASDAGPRPPRRTGRRSGSRPTSRSGRSSRAGSPSWAARRPERATRDRQSAPRARSVTRLYAWSRS